MSVEYDWSVLSNQKNDSSEDKNDFMNLSLCQFASLTLPYLPVEIVAHAQGPWAETGIVLNQKQNDAAGKKVECKLQTEEADDSAHHHNVRTKMDLFDF